MILEWILVTNILALVGLGLGWGYSTYIYRKEKPLLVEEFKTQAIAMFTDPVNLTKFAGAVRKSVETSIAGKFGVTEKNKKAIEAALKGDLKGSGLMAEVRKFLPGTSAIVEQDKGMGKMMGLIQMLPQLMEIMKAFKGARGGAPAAPELTQWNGNITK